MHVPDLITIINSIGYLGLFIIVLFESGVPATFFLPGDSLLFTTGFLASQGHLNVGILIPLLFVAAVLGYIFGYGLGKKIGQKLFTNPDSFWFNPERLVYAHNFFEKYGAKTILIGRFVPIVRSFCASIAGAAEMNYRKFITYTFVGGIFWTGGVTMLGFYLGRIIPNANAYLTPIILLIIFISILPTIYEYIVHRWRGKR